MHSLELTNIDKSRVYRPGKFVPTITYLLTLFEKEIAPHKFLFTTKNKWKTDKTVYLKKMSR